MLDMFKFLPTLLDASVMTIKVTLSSAVVALAMSLIAGIARISRFWLVRALTRVYVELFRGAAALIILFWIYYALPFFGITLDALTAAIIGLGLNVGAYGSEVVRGAILAVPKGQYEAATALNFTRGQTLRWIVFPQAVVMMMPPLGNLFIELLKATALVSLITITELTSRAVQLNNVTFRTMEVFTLVLIIYFVFAMVITVFMRTIEWRLSLRLGRERRLL